MAEVKTRGPRSIVGPDTWMAIRSSVQFRQGMVIIGDANKKHADKWVNDAENLESEASKLKELANHVYNGTKPIVTPVSAPIHRDLPEFQKALSALQKKFSKLTAKV